MNMHTFIYTILGIALAVIAVVSASPLHPRDAPTPTFPPSPPSCPICEPNFPSIDSCAQAAPVLANFTDVIFNPSAFISVIQCACTDTFQSAYPQCVDCFIQTNQTQFLEPTTSTDTDPSEASTALPALITSIRSLCAIESTLLGNVSGADGENASSSASPTPTPSASSAAFRRAEPISTWIFTTVLGSYAGIGIGGAITTFGILAGVVTVLF